MAIAGVQNLWNQYNPVPPVQRAVEFFVGRNFRDRIAATLFSFYQRPSLSHHLDSDIIDMSVFSSPVSSPSHLTTSLPTKAFYNQSESLLTFKGELAEEIQGKLEEGLRILYQRGFKPLSATELKKGKWNLGEKDILLRLVLTLFPSKIELKEGKGKEVREFDPKKNKKIIESNSKIKKIPTGDLKGQLKVEACRNIEKDDILGLATGLVIRSTEARKLISTLCESILADFEEDKKDSAYIEMMRDIYSECKSSITTKEGGKKIQSLLRELIELCAPQHGGGEDAALRKLRYILQILTYNHSLTFCRHTFFGLYHKSFSLIVIPEPEKGMEMYHFMNYASFPGVGGVKLGNPNITCAIPSDHDPQLHPYFQCIKFLVAGQDISKGKELLQGHA